jgi:hypothetical protein
MTFTLAILRAVEHIGAHKATGQKQSVSIYLSLLLLLIFFFLTLFLNLFYFIQPPWGQEMNLLFQLGVACESYKHPKHTYDFKNKVLSVLKGLWSWCPFIF